MKNNYLSLLCTILLMALALSISNANSASIEPDQSTTGTWCVAKPDAPDSRLAQFIKDTCSSSSRMSLDCSAISEGEPCFEPNTVRFHASYVLDKKYRFDLGCDPDLGVIVQKDPSTKTCQFP